MTTRRAHSGRLVLGAIEICFVTITNDAETDGCPPSPISTTTAPPIVQPITVSPRFAG